MPRSKPHPLPKIFSLKVYSLKSLQELTQLSFTDLREALVSLTTQGRGILYADFAEEKGRKRSRMSPEGVAYPCGGSDQTDSVPIPFRSTTLFTLNEKFTSTEIDTTWYVCVWVYVCVEERCLDMRKGPHCSSL